ncbi:NAD(P)-binding protein, partial [Caulochytrium protostelioides]
MLPATRQAPPTAAAAAARLARAAVTTTRRYDHQVVQRVPENAVYQTAGPGGRSSRGDRVVTVFGSTGFLSRYLCRNWAKNGNTLVVPFRASDEDKRHLKVMGDLGQVIPMRWHIEDEKSIAECVRHADVVYNLVGRDFETKNFTFNKAMVEGAQRIARICREEGVERMVHVSALNANVNSPSRFLQAKALGEEVVRAEFADATIVRPAGTYGVEDRFFNRLGWLMRVLPFGIPLPRNGNA